MQSEIITRQLQLLSKSALGGETIALLYNDKYDFLDVFARRIFRVTVFSMIEIHLMIVGAKVLELLTKGYNQLSYFHWFRVFLSAIAGFFHGVSLMATYASASVGEHSSALVVSTVTAVLT